MIPKSAFFEFFTGSTLNLSDYKDIAKMTDTDFTT